jgi:YYY domain-containing protein
MTLGTPLTPKRKLMRPWVYDLLLVYILLIGAYFRFTGLSWGEYQYLHPDERFLVWVGTDIQPIGTPQDQLGSPPSVATQPWRAPFVSSLPDCQAWGGYFDTACSPLNPNNRGHDFYVYGTFPMFLTRYVVQWVYGHSGFDVMTNIGRALAALFDLGTVLLAYLVGTRLYDRRVGLLAAAFYAFAAFPIQQSHFFTMDTFITFFAMLGVYFAVEVLVGDWFAGRRLKPAIRERAIEAHSADPPAPGEVAQTVGETGGYLLPKFSFSRFVHQPLFLLCLGFGIALGMAMASKVSAAPLALLLPAAMLIRLYGLPATEQRRRALDAAVYLALGAVVSFLVFRVLQPYAFTGPGFFGLKLNPAWISNLIELRNQTTGDVDFPPAIQWARRPIWFAGYNLTVWGMGLPLGLLAWAGFFWMGWRMIKGEWRKHAMLWGWTALYFTWQSSGFNPTMRYQLPIYPTLAIFAGWAVVSLYERKGQIATSLAQMRSFWMRAIANWRRILAVTIGVVVVISTLAYGFAFSGIYDRPITRVAASRWIYQNIPGPINLPIQTSQGVDNQPVPYSQGYVIQPGVPYVASFVPQADGTLNEIDLTHVVDRLASKDPKTLSVTISSLPSLDQPLATARLTSVLEAVPDTRGQGYVLPLDHAVVLRSGETYYVQISLLTEAGRITLEGSSIAVEGAWDDSLPVRLDNYDGYGGIYHGYAFDMYEDDNPAKLARYLSILDNTDYITISSSRQWGSLPRIPERYPMSTEYYRWLLGCPTNRSIEWCYSVAIPGKFTGQLGFDLVQVFQSDPKIGPIDINDQLAEEAFTVYDHPKVLIFKKRSDYNPQQVSALLGSVDLSKVVHLSPLKATSLVDRILPVNLVNIEKAALSRGALSGAATSKDMLLSPEQQAVQYTGGTWSQLFDINAWYNRWPGLGAVLWYLVVFLLGLITYPILRVIFSALPDRGYPFTRTAGMLILSYLVWLAGSFNIPFNRLTISAAVITILLVGGGMAYWKRAELRKEWRERRNYFLLIEGLFLAFFMLDLLIRLGNPDLWHPWKGGEKPMDFSYFNAVLKSTVFPPYDPWFAGGYINYYYYGFVFVGVLVKWLGIVPAIAYNLILPTIFAMIALGAFSVAWNLFVHKEDRDDQGGPESPPERLPNTVEPADTRERSPGTWEMASAISSGEEPGRWGARSLTANASGWLRVDSQANYREGIFEDEVTVTKDRPAGESTIDSTSIPQPGLPAAGYAPRTRGRSLQEVLSISGISHQALAVGLAAAFGMALLGNLGTLRMFFQGYQKLVAPDGNIDNVSVLTHWVWAARGFMQVLSGAQLPFGLADWYWNPSRAIPAPGEVEPITEFPFFTVLYGDPHAHLFAMPLALLALGWILSILLAKNRQRQGLSLLSSDQAFSARLSGLASSIIPVGLSFLLGGLVIGSLRPTNTWDLPTYLVIGVVAVGYSAMQVRDLQIKSRLLALFGRPVVRALLGIVLLVGLAFLLFEPYARWYVPGYNSVDLWKGTHTPIWSYLTHWGLFLFVIVSWMAWETRDWMASTPISALRKLVAYQVWIWTSLALLVAAVALLLSMQVYIAWLVLPLAAWAGVLLLRPGLPDAKRAVLFMVGTGLVLTLMVEIVVLHGDIARMNTVFKFYLQVWTLFAVSAAAGFGWLIGSLAKWKPSWRNSWQIALGLLVASAALYPILASSAKIKDRMAPNAPHTLDGMAYMDYAQYQDLNTTMDLSQDYRAIRWMQENVIGSPVIVEANQVEYHWGTRFTIYTGLPNVVGWNWHQRQQRATTSEVVQARVNEVNNFYITTSIDQAKAFLQKYNVRYIIVGQLEHALYPGPGLTKFEQYNGVLWSAIYKEEDTVIYVVNSNP